MKNHRFFGFALLPPLFFACQMNETEAPEREPLAALVVQAQVEAPAYEEDTKVFMDSQYKLYWNEGDQISIFPMTTQNCLFTFLGQDGDKSGNFSTIAMEGVSVTPVDRYYAAYPYREENGIGTDGVLSLTLPAEQAYHADTFDPQAQLMAAVSGTSAVKFKNICCVMGFQLYGAGVKVKSISLSGHRGEILAGPIHVVAGDEPSFSFTQEAISTSITLTADTAVELDASEPTFFWMVLPPISFQDGLSLTVTDDEGNTFVKTTEKTISLQRNKAYSMAAFEVIPGGDIPTAPGIYLEGSQPYEFSAATDQVNLYEAEGQVWARFLTPGTLTVREIGPISASVSQGDTFEATYTEMVAGETSVSADYSLEVISLENGILTLVAADRSYFVLRF